MAARHWQSRRKKALPKNVWHALALPKRRRFLSLSARSRARAAREHISYASFSYSWGAGSLAPHLAVPPSKYQKLARLMFYGGRVHVQK